MRKNLQRLIITAVTTFGLASVTATDALAGINISNHTEPGQADS